MTFQTDNAADSNAENENVKDENVNTENESNENTETTENTDEGRERRGRGRGRMGGGRPGRDERHGGRDFREMREMREFAMGAPRGGGRGHRGGRRHGRGDVRAALLVLIAEQPRHGYELMTEISERTEGAWRPSPGSVYPALQLLQDEGLVITETGEAGRRVAKLTPEGEKYVELKKNELDAVWESFRDDSSNVQREAFKKLQGLSIALKQVAQVGTPAQVGEAAKVVEQAQRKLYAILAQDPGDSEGNNAN